MARGGDQWAAEPPAPALLFQPPVSLPAPGAAVEAPPLRGTGGTRGVGVPGHAGEGQSHGGGRNGQCQFPFSNTHIGSLTVQMGWVPYGGALHGKHPISSSSRMRISSSILFSTLI